MTDETAAVLDTPAPITSEDDELGAMFDKLTAEEGVTQEEDAGEAPVEAEAAQEVAVEEAKPEAVAAPPDLPASIKAKWGDMTPEVQEAVLASQRDLSRKLADQGRTLQASRPVYDVLVQAAQELPSLQNMTPDQIAQDVFAMAKIQHNMNNDPVKTLIGIAAQYGVTDSLRQMMGAAPATDADAQRNSMAQEIAALRKELQQSANPAMIDARISQFAASKEVENTVTSYAATKENWSVVESVIPTMIPLAKARLGEGASAKDVLDAAYDMAVYADPDLRAKVMTAATAPAKPDPARTAAQLAAKSVNVTSRPNTSKQLTEDQQYEAIWNKHRS